MTAPNEGPYVTLERVRTDREYRVKGAPDPGMPAPGVGRVALRTHRPAQRLA
jgi:hypothetical protein